MKCSAKMIAEGAAVANRHGYALSPECLEDIYNMMASVRAFEAKQFEDRAKAYNRAYYDAFLKPEETK